MSIKLKAVLTLILASHLSFAQIYFFHDFQDETFPDGTVIYDLDQTSNLLFQNDSWFTREIAENKISAWSSGFTMDGQETKVDNWFIIPDLEIQEETLLSFLYRKYNNNQSKIENLKIMISEDGLEPSDFNLLKNLNSSQYNRECNLYVDLQEYANKKINIAFVHQIEKGGHISIDDITLTANASQSHDIRTESSIPSFPYVYPGPHDLKLKITQLTEEPITSLQVNYSIDGGINVVSKGLTCPYFYQQVGKFTLEDFLVFTEPGVYKVDIWTSLPNGTSDIQDSNNYESIQVVVLEESAKRKLLLEEFTATWCSFCTRAPLDVKDLLDEFGEENFVITALHGNDDLAIPAFEELISAIPNLTSGFPTVSLNRFQPSVNIDNVAVANTDLWRDNTINLLRHPSPANLNAEITFDEESRSLKIDAKTQFIGKDAGDLRLHCLLTEDGITGYPQSNAYNDSINYVELYQAGNPIVDYVHNHTLRTYLSEALGDQDVIADEINIGDEFGKEYEYIVPDEFKAENLKVILYLSKNPNEGSDVGQFIVNAESFDLVDFISGISESEILSNEIQIQPNPSTGLFMVNFDGVIPSEITITDNLGRKVKDFNIQSKTTSIDLNGLVEGIYFMQMNMNGYLISKKLIKL